MVTYSLGAVGGLPLVIMSLRGVAACNDKLECCSLLVKMLRIVFRVQDAFSTMVMLVLT